jgi:hypothetical protein
MQRVANAARSIFESTGAPGWKVYNNVATGEPFFAGDSEGGKAKLKVKRLRPDELTLSLFEAR